MIPNGGGNRWLRETAKPTAGARTGWRFLGLFRAERGRLALVFGLVALGSGLGLVIPWLVGRYIDGLAHPGLNPVWTILLVLAAAYGTDALLTFSEGRLMARISQQLVSVLRTNLFSVLAKLPTSFFDKTPQGDLMSRLTNDVDNISTSVTQSALTLLGGSLLVVGTFVMMLVLCPMLTLAAVLSVTLVLTLTRVVSARTRKNFREQQARLGKMGSLLEETLTGLEVVHAFGRQEVVRGAFRTANTDLAASGYRAQLWAGLMMPLMNVVANLSFALTAFVGGYLAVQGTISVGTVATFLIYSRQFSRPINDLANVYNVLQTALAGAERIFAILDEPPETADPPAARPLMKPRGDVVFEEVEFGYRPDVPVLRKVSFSVPAGQSLALVGPTGCGKTTVVNLLMRFYDLTGGRILVDGTDLKEYTRSSLWKHFGVVLQDTALFRGTIEENIAYGRPGATADEILDAAVRAQADPFIRHLPQGYQTVLTENGSPLSQGQRQLVAIARALVADPAFLVLDEATSSVDTRTEFLLQAAVKEALKDRTSFLIAHRLSTIRDAHHILVMDRGQIVEQGSHTELLALHGVYHRMHSLQTRSAGQEGSED